MVATPIVGISARRSCPGLASFTSTPAGPGRVTAGMRASMASVPSTASTASTMPCCTTQAWPISAAPMIFSTAIPRSISAIAAVSGARVVSRPGGASASPKMSCAPSRLNPSSPSTRNTAASNPSSPAKAARPILARSFTPSASGRREKIEGRLTGPIITRSVQACARKA